MANTSCTVYKDAYEASLDSSAVLILTEWDQFRYPALSHTDSALHKQPTHGTEAIKLTRTLSELDVLDIVMQKKYKKQTALEASEPTGTQNLYFEQPSCAEGCRDCERGMAEVIAAENVEWARIAYGMKKPKWVFDGRGIVEVSGMEKLGFRVEVIGRAGSRSRLHGFDA